MAYSLTSGFALTRDEFDELRAAPCVPPSPARPPEQSSLDFSRRIYKAINDEELSVRFNEAGAYFTVEVGTASAVLKLTQARDLAVVLSGTLSGWRAETVFRP